MGGGTADLMSEPMGDDLSDLMSEPVEAAPTMAGAKAMTMRGAKKKAAAAPLRKGKANAARVSRGTEVDTWHGLSVKAPVGSDMRLADLVYHVAVVHLSVNSSSLGSVWCCRSGIVASTSQSRL